MRSNLILALALVSSLAALACKPQESSPPAGDPEPSEPATVVEPSPEPTEDAAPSPESEALCKHSLGIMRADLGDLVSWTPEEEQEQQRTCAIDIEKKRAETAPEEFARKSECILAASTVDALAACG